MNLIFPGLLYTEQSLEQVCRNRFVPVSLRRGCYHDLQSDFDAILRVYRRRTYQMMTINDHDALADDKTVKGKLQALLAAGYPQQSGFE